MGFGLQVRVDAESPDLHAGSESTALSIRLSP